MNRCYKFITITVVFITSIIAIFAIVFLARWSATDSRNNHSIFKFECGKQVNSKSTSNNNNNQLLRRQKRIINGTHSAIHSWPWMALIYYDSEMDHICGGVLIHDRYVLTAAHCLTDIDVSNYTIFIGVNDLLDVNSSNAYYVDKIISHEGYNHGGLYNDVALIRLNTSVKLSSEVSIVCLPNYDFKNEHLHSRNGFVVGWGDVTNSNSSTEGENSILRESVLKVLHQDECEKTFIHMNETLENGSYLEECNYPENISDTHFDSEKTFCAIDPIDVPHTGVCSGDSGGPYLIDINGKWTAVGIISFATSLCKGGCDVTQPSFFHKTHVYLDWILKNIEN